MTATIQNKDINFFKLPAERLTINYRREWIVQLKREDPIPKNFFVCSKHFELECFERDLKSELLGLLPKSKMKVDAIPYIISISSGKVTSRISEKSRSKNK